MGGNIGLPCCRPNGQFKRVKGPLLKPYQIVELRQGDKDVHHPIDSPEARNIIGDGETKGLNHLGSLPLPQTVASRVTGVYYQQCP